MQLHDVKIWPDFYARAETGDKTFELRKNDRDYRVGDIVRLHEWKPEDQEYTGRVLVRRITYITHGGRFGLQEGYVCFSLTPCSYP